MGHSVLTVPTPCGRRLTPTGERRARKPSFLAGHRPRAWQAGSPWTGRLQVLVPPTSLNTVSAQNVPGTQPLTLTSEPSEEEGMPFRACSQGTRREFCCEGKAFASKLSSLLGSSLRQGPGGDTVRRLLARPWGGAMPPGSAGSPAGETSDLQRLSGLITHPCCPPAPPSPLPSPPGGDPQPELQRNAAFLSS